MNFTYSRKVRFSDTDAAGVVYFARYLSICHEAYEEALCEAGFELSRFFSDEGVIIPVSHSRCDYLRSLQCGDVIEVEILAERLKESEFALDYKIWRAGPPRKLTARARTIHVCIDSTSRSRRPLPDRLAEWIPAS